MFWSFGSDGFQSITEALARDDCTVSKIAQIETVRLAFKKQHNKLLDFLFNNLFEMLDIVLGQSEQTYSQSVCQTCLFFLSNPCPAFSTRLQNNLPYLNKLNDFISKSEPSADGLISFSRIIESLIKSTNGFILNNFPEKNDFLPKLLKYIDNSAIFCLLHFITDIGYQNVLEFLDAVKATELLISMLSEDDQLTEKILVLLTNIVCSGFALSNMVSYLIQLDQLEIIFNYCINSPFKKVQSSAFNLLLELCGLCDDDCDNSEEEDAFIQVFSFIVDKVPQICEFVHQEKTFTSSETRACDLIVGALTAMNDAPDCVFNLVCFLYEKMFSYPNHSILHLSFYSLFTSIVEKDATILQRFDFQSPLTNKFNHKDEISANYWGVLFKMTHAILATKHTNEESPEWNNYIESIFQPMDKVIKTDYGGSFPNDSEEEEFDSEELFSNSRLIGNGIDINYGNDDSDEEDEFFEEEEEDLDTKTTLIDDSC